MEDKTITAVGIDVSKGKSTVAVRRPGGEVVLTPFSVEHDAAGLSSLVKTLGSIGGDIRIVMEHTGMYWRPIALALKEAGFFRQRGQRHAHPRLQRQLPAQGQDRQGRLHEDRQLRPVLLGGATGLLAGG